MMLHLYGVSLPISANLRTDEFIDARISTVMQRTKEEKWSLQAEVRMKEEVGKKEGERADIGRLC